MLGFLQGKIQLAKWLHVFSYVLLFSTLLINNAVLLILLLPLGVLFLLGGIYFWLGCVLKEARGKEIL